MPWPHACQIVGDSATAVTGSPGTKYSVLSLFFFFFFVLSFFWCQNNSKPFARIRNKTRRFTKQTPHERTSPKTKKPKAKTFKMRIKYEAKRENTDIGALRAENDNNENFGTGNNNNEQTKQKTRPVDT
jgi:hypothetical protein